MVSLRNEVRKKRRTAENKQVQNSESFRPVNDQLTEKKDLQQQITSEKPVKVSNDADNLGLQGFLAKNEEEARVCTNANNASVESLLRNDEGESRVCEERDNIRVSAKAPDDNDEDNIPIGKMLILSKKAGKAQKKKEQPVLQNDDSNNNANGDVVRAKNGSPVKEGVDKGVKLERTGKDSDFNGDVASINNPLDVPARRNKKGEAQKEKQQVVRQIEGDAQRETKQIVLQKDHDHNCDDFRSQNGPPVKDEAPGIGKGVKFEEKDNGFDDDDETSPLIKYYLSGRGKGVRAKQADKDCDVIRNSKFREGDMVWARVKSHPWWPGQVYNPIFASPSARKNWKEKHMLIAFFGDCSYGWFVESDLVPFEVNYVEKSKQPATRAFEKAVEEAVDEISRRAALGLMCVCRNGEAFKPRKQEGYVNVDVQGYVTSGLYLMRQIEEAKNGFKPASMLSFVRRMAMSPGSGEDRCILGIKSIAEVLAYRATTFVSVNEDYQEALRITESVGHTDADVLDQYDPESEVVRGVSTTEPALVDEQKVNTKNVKVKDPAGRLISLRKSSDKEERYVLKKREEFNKHSPNASDDYLINYIIQADFVQTPITDSGAEEDDTDSISRYVFKKRVKIEEAKPIERKEERTEKRKEDRTTKKGVARKAFQMKALDIENESDYCTVLKKTGEAELSNEDDIKEAQARQKEIDRKAFHKRSMDKGKESDKSPLSMKMGESEGLNGVCSFEVGMSSDITLMPGINKESNDLSSINDIAGLHAGQVEGGQTPTKVCQQQNEKKPAATECFFTNNNTSGMRFDVDGNGISFDKSTGPAIMCVEEIGDAGNVLQGISMFNCEEVSYPPKLNTGSINASDELQRMQTSFMGVDKESFLVNDVEQGNQVLALAKRSPKLEAAALEMASDRISNGNEFLHNVDLLACNALPPSEGQEIKIKAESAFENASTSFQQDASFSDSSVEPKTLKSLEIGDRAHCIDSKMPGRSDNSIDGSCPNAQQKLDNIYMPTETERAFSELPVSTADVLMDESLELTGSLDHAVIKKTKGFKRLVKFEKSSGLKDAKTKRNKVNRIKRICNNNTGMSDDLEPLEKQRKILKVVESNFEAPMDLTPCIATVDSTFDCGSAAFIEDNQVQSPIFLDQSKGCEIPCKEVYSENSRSFVQKLMDDLLSLALDPFYGIERDCPSKVSQVFLKFRSLVYLKSLTSILSSEASKTLLSLNDIEDDRETKDKSAVKGPETLLPLSNSKDLNIGNFVKDGSTDSEPIEIAPVTSSKTERSASQVLKTGRNQAPEAKENRKRKLVVKADCSSSLRRLRKLKDLESVPSKKSDSRSSVPKTSGVLKGDLHESVQRPKVSKKSYFYRSSNSSKSREEPMALCMKFPPGFALPSEVQLKVRFARFGPLDVSGTRIYCNSNSAQVVFKHGSDAETAYAYATENSLFGQADVSFRLKQISHPKKDTSVLQSGAELTKLSRVKNDDACTTVPVTGKEDINLPGSLDKDGITETVADSTPKSIHQVQAVVQLKSCLKKLDDSGNDSGKETARVKFVLDREEPSPVLQIAMDGLSQIENVNIPADTSLPLENNTIVEPPIENNAMEPDPPNISHQMLYLLMKCNDIVTDISRSLGYIPYCAL